MCVEKLIAFSLITTLELFLLNSFKRCLLIIEEEAKHEPHEAFIWMQSINYSLSFLLSRDTCVRDSKVLQNSFHAYCLPNQKF